ncbi:MAG: ComEC/Rec2 family competence protein [Ruminococcus sp.]|nr:ComEC/Rec2 family competence protein [Ruminococcus sp.]
MSKSQTVERKLFYAAAGWLSGLAVCAALSAIYVIPAAAGAFVLAAVLCVIKRPCKSAAKLAIVLAALTLAAVRSCSYDVRVYQPLRECSGQVVTMRGIVTDIKIYDSRTYITIRGRLRSNGIKTGITFTDYASDKLRCGDEVLVQGAVRTPQSYLTFDKEDYNRSLGVFLEGDGLANIRLLQKRRDPLIYAMRSARDGAISAIRRRLPGQEGAFLTAVLCSDKTALNAETTSAIYRAGLGQLFAVSGTHVIMLCSFIGALLELLMCPARVKSALLTVFLLLFAVFSGCSPSVLRACIMMEMTLLGGFFNRQSDSASSLGLAAIILTLRCPYVLSSISFMLSFTAAFAIGTVAPAVCRRRVSGKVARSAVAVMSINLLSAPICVLSFSEVSLISAAANLLMIPLCSACLAVCFAYILTGCTVTPLLAAAGLMSRLVIGVCRAVTRSGFSYIGTYHRRQLLMIAVAAAAALIVCSLLRKRRGIVIFTCVTAYVFCICGFIICDRLPKRNTVTVYPAKWGCTEVMGCGDEVIIFDSGGLGSNAYAAARKAEQRHPRRIYLYTVKNRPKDYSALTDKLSGVTDYCYDDRPEGDRLTGGSDLARFSDGELIVTVDGKHIKLGSDSVIIDGRKYVYGQFYGISEFNL